MSNGVTFTLLLFGTGAALAVWSGWRPRWPIVDAGPKPEPVQADGADLVTEIAKAKARLAELQTKAVEQAAAAESHAKELKEAAK